MTMLTYGAHGQGVAVMGKVLDGADRSPLEAAAIVLQSDTLELQAIADQRGTFRFPEVIPGFYKVTLSYVGYQSKVIGAVDLRRGRGNLGEIFLNSSANAFDEVVVKAEARTRGLPASEIHTITVEEIVRFPATFYDPARLASNYAGVISENDQANSVVVRGNHPAHLKWYLHDVEIVNPNHLANAGAFGDRSAASGGGVNILSAQLLDNTRFHKGAFDASFGNVLGGVMDMNFRDGDSDKTRFKGQIGLIGIDAALEGPLANGKPHSFLVNYRYSTLGILSAMGVDLGDEDIGFQDLAFNLNFQLPGAKLTIFGMGGSSSNEFRSPEDREEWESFKDRQDIDFNADMGAIGVQLHSGRFSASLVYSGLDHQRQSTLYAEVGGRSQDFEQDLLKESRTGAHLVYSVPINGNSQLRLGTRLSLIDYRLRTFRGVGEQFAFEGDDNGFLGQFYGDYEIGFTDQISASLGLHATTFSLTTTGSLEPRLRFRYDLDNSTSIGVHYGLHSQLPDAGLLLYQGSDGRSNSSLELLKSHHAGITYRRFFDSNTKLVAELFYQNLYDIPAITDAGSTFSAINHLPYVPFEKFDNRGTGVNAGIEIGYSKYFDGSSFFEFSASYISSEYTASDGAARSSRWDNGYSVNATGGKEFKLREIDKILGVNLRAVARGGFWESPINAGLSQQTLRTIYQEPAAFSEQLGAFYKVDLRIYYKRNRKRYSSIVGLDLLNVTNAKSVLYYVWDPYLEQRDPVEQLGLIPNLSYRIEF